MTTWGRWHCKGHNSFSTDMCMYSMMLWTMTVYHWLLAYYVLRFDQLQLLLSNSHGCWIAHCFVLVSIFNFYFPVHESGGEVEKQSHGPPDPIMLIAMVIYGDCQYNRRVVTKWRLNVLSVRLLGMVCCNLCTIGCKMSNPCTWRALYPQNNSCGEKGWQPL